MRMEKILVLPRLAQRRVLRVIVAAMVLLQVTLLVAAVWHLSVAGWSLPLALAAMLLVGLLLQISIAANTFVIKWLMGDWPVARRGSIVRWLPVAAVEVFWMLRLFLFDQPWCRAPRWIFATDRRTPVLLVHGFVCNGAVWRPLSKHLLDAKRSHVAISLEPTYRHFERQLEVLDGAVQALCAHTGQQRVVLLGHSMGGLLARAYAERFPQRCAALISVGVPHHGTALGDLIHGLEYGPPSPRCQWLQALNQRSGERIEVPALNIWSADDNIVIPAQSAHLHATTERTLHGYGHMALIAQREACLALMAALDELDPLVESDER